VTFALLRPVTGPSYDLVGIMPDISVPPDSDALVVAEALIGQSAGAAKRLAAAPHAPASGRINALRKEYGRAGVTPMAFKKVRIRL